MIQSWYSYIYITFVPNGVSLSSSVEIYCGSDVLKSELDEALEVVCEPGLLLTILCCPLFQLLDGDVGRLLCWRKRA